jgi:hypothetical protein
VAIAVNFFELFIARWTPDSHLMGLPPPPGRRLDGHRSFAFSSVKTFEVEVQNNFPCGHSLQDGQFELTSIQPTASVGVGRAGLTCVASLIVIAVYSQYSEIVPFRRSLSNHVQFVAPILEHWCLMSLDVGDRRGNFFDFCFAVALRGWPIQSSLFN